MNRTKPSWVFPAVKTVVGILYYFLLAVLVVFTLMSIIKFFQLQKERTNFEEQPANYISVPVSWGPKESKTLATSEKPIIYLKPEKSTGELEVPIRSFPGMVMVALGIVGIGTAMWTFLLLRRIFRSVSIESPFHKKNARRIQIMGLLFLGQSIIELFLKVLLWNVSSPYFEQIDQAFRNSLSVDLNLDGPWLLGLILLALSQVYRRGIELQTENELTV